MSPPAQDSKVKPLPVWKSFGASATAACTAELLTIPLDTAKVKALFEVYLSILKTHQKAWFVAPITSTKIYL